MSNVQRPQLPWKGQGRGDAKGGGKNSAKSKSKAKDITNDPYAIQPQPRQPKPVADPDAVDARLAVLAATAKSGAGLAWECSGCGATHDIKVTICPVCSQPKE